MSTKHMQKFNSVCVYSSDEALLLTVPQTVYKRSLLGITHFKSLKLSVSFSPSPPAE